MENNTMENNTSLETQNTEGQATETTVEKTYSEAEVQSLIDRKVTQALQTQARKNEAKMKEAQKLAKMNEQEKYEYELSQREAAILEKEKELALAENKNVASQILAEKGISLALVDFVVAEDADSMKHNIDILSKEFDKSVKAAVEKRLASKTPKQNLPLDKPIDKQAFAKMSTIELMELRNNNPELFEQLSHQ